MHLRRGPLFWGLVLVCLGAIPLLVRAGYLDASRFDEAWRLWPLILVAVGLSILLGRGRTGLAGTVGLALVVGIVGGGALAGGFSMFGNVTDCAGTSAPLSSLSEAGVFEGKASVTLDLNCGSLTVTLADQGGWALEAGHRNRPPSVTATGTSLVVAAPDGSHRQEWRLALPVATTGSLRLTANASTSAIEVGRGVLDLVEADLNAGDLRIDARDGTIRRLDVSMNAGRARITLGATAVTGSLSANAGSFELCVPPAVGLRLQATDQLTFVHNLDDRGLAREGDTWTRPGSSGAMVDLEIDGNAANFTLDPEGGC